MMAQLEMQLNLTAEGTIECTAVNVANGTADGMIGGKLDEGPDSN